MIKKNEIGQLKNQMQQKWNDYIEYWINYLQNLKLNGVIQWTAQFQTVNDEIELQLKQIEEEN